jgi:hypothetical protein
MGGAVLAVLAGLGSGGCGVISSDVTNFDLTLPDKKFTIDASQWNVTQSDADKVLAISCSSDTMCNSAVQTACQMGCSGMCDAARTCDLSLDISLTKKVDLVTEKPELKSINDEPVIKVTVDSVTYEIPINMLNVATPTISVYVAPITVLKPDPTNPQIKLIGTIPPIPAGQTATAPQMLMFTPSGKVELVNIMSTFKTPFNVLVGSSLLVTAGQKVPTGKLEAVIHIKGHAGL